ncbi:MAG: hypothetical protein OSB00_09750 [Sphingomonas bacterium]|nr:hypothetical protein [Sphingomonas bacterium]
MALAPTLSAVETGDETQLFLDVGAGLVEVAEIIDLPELPSGAQTTFETTHMKSGRYKEFKKNTRLEGNEVDITGNYVIGSDAEATLLAAEASRDAIAYKIVVIQGEDIFNVEGYALFMSLRRSNPMDDRRQFTITAKWVDAETTTVAA